MEIPDTITVGSQQYWMAPYDEGWQVFTSPRREDASLVAKFAIYIEDGRDEYIYMYLRAQPMMFIRAA